MAQSQKNKIKEFMQTIHYRDICYLIDHIDNLDVLNSCAEELGYSVGISIVKNKPQLKSVTIGNKNEFRIVSSIREKTPIIECIIFQNKN